MSIKIGSLFAGIGGFELGLERAIPGAQTIWQVEQNAFCQSILQKHWPHAQLFDDVCAVGAHNLPPVDILCGGFPCQDISLAGKGEGLNGKKSSLWFEMRRIISELRPPIIIMENVAAITIRGLSTVLADLAELRYDAEWCIISARDFGAPHLRKRWFCVAYPNRSGLQKTRTKQQTTRHKQHRKLCSTLRSKNHTKDAPVKPAICRNDYGFSAKLDKERIMSLGNAIVPQCSQWIGEQVLSSGLLDEHYNRICEASK